MQGDIRLKIIDLRDAINILTTFEQNWIYIKMVSHIAEGNTSCAYFKFKLNSFRIYNNDVFFQGVEDEDRLYIKKEDIFQTECSFNNDEILLRLRSSNMYTEIFIKKYLPTLSTRLDELNNSKNNIIITEGKTDWQHLKNAFTKFRDSGLFTNLNISFFEFDKNIDMGYATLKKIRDYHSLLENEYCKIFVFDRDVEEINREFGDKEFIYHGNNVYSILLPVPTHRISTPNISIEHYYFDDYLFSIDNHGRRLYMVNEFDKISKRHLSTSNLYALKVNKHLNDITILDDKVMMYEGEWTDFSEIAQKGKNIALSKADFVKYILRPKKEKFKEIDISPFKIFFEKIQEVLDDYKMKNVGELINEGVYLKKFASGISILSIFAEVPLNILKVYRAYDLLGVSCSLSDNKNELIINISILNEGDLYHIVDVPIRISEELETFLYNKYNNRFNRIEFYLKSPETEYTSYREIFKDNVASLELLRTLDLRNEI